MVDIVCDAYTVLRPNHQTRHCNKSERQQLFYSLPPQFKY